MQHLEASVNHTAFRVVENDLPPGEDVHLRLRRASDASLASDCVCHQKGCVQAPNCKVANPRHRGLPVSNRCTITTPPTPWLPSQAQPAQLLFYVQYQACATPISTENPLVLGASANSQQLSLPTPAVAAAPLPCWIGSARKTW